MGRTHKISKFQPQIVSYLNATSNARSRGNIAISRPAQTHAVALEERTMQT